MASEMVYVGRDNAIRYSLLESGVMADITGVNRIVLDIETTSGGDVVTIDSTVDQGEAFKDGGYVAFKLGGVSELVAGQSYRATLVTYDPDNPNGIHWGSFGIRVVDES